MVKIVLLHLCYYHPYEADINDILNKAYKEFV